jgi:hypothetical protein
MHTKPLLVIVGLVLMLCAGCGDSPDSVMQDALSCAKEMGTVMQSVKDEASAQAAAPKLKAIGARMQDIEKRQKALKLSKEEETALQAKYKPQMEEIAKGLVPDMMRVMTMGIKDKDFNDALKAGQTLPQ